MEKKITLEDQFTAVERERILNEYARREVEVDGDLYAPWQAGQSLILAERNRKAAFLLYQSGVFPVSEDQCLEIGYGKLGWLGELITWGVRENNLYGIELDASRAEKAKSLLPAANLQIGDAVKLPWEDDKFKLIIASTVFSSILDLTVRRLIAGEITRVLAPGGALLWYDIAVNNPGNKNITKISRRELKILFPMLEGQIIRVTLAPPLARKIAPVSWALATFLETVPFLRTHLLAVLKKP